MRDAESLRDFARRYAIGFRLDKQAKDLKPGRLRQAAQRIDHPCFVHMSGYADGILQTDDKDRSIENDASLILLHRKNRSRGKVFR